MGSRTISAYLTDGEGRTFTPNDGDLVQFVPRNSPTPCLYVRFLRGDTPLFLKGDSTVGDDTIGGDVSIVRHPHQDDATACQPMLRLLSALLRCRFHRVAKTTSPGALTYEIVMRPVF